MMRIGIGYDVHAFVSDRPLILGGIQIPHSKGLLGHSDADVLTHAIMDAILGALALGNIGTFFPDSDPRFKDINSLHLLAEVIKKMDEKKYKIGNVDSVLICENPKLNPHILAIRTSLANALGISLDQLGLKATTSEKMGFLGREEGIACQSIVLLESI